MNNYLSDIQSNKSLNACAMFFLIVIACIPESAAVTKFGTESGTNPPAALKIEDIWFYDEHMQKVIPDMDMQWMSVVFASDFFVSDVPVADTRSIATISQEMVENNDALVDSFYDKNLSGDACFFQLRNSITINELQALITELNQLSFVSYVHPVIRIKNRLFAFFNAFEMEWKTGVAPEIKDRIMRQAHVSLDQDHHIYRVDLFQVPIFNAINLLAEDIHSVNAMPYLVELNPTIRADLSLTVNGGNVGDKLPFVFRISFSDLVDIDPSSIANIDLRPRGIQKELFELKIDPYDYVTTAAVSPIRITGWLKIFAPGEFVILPLKIKYTCATCSDIQVRSIETNTITVRIASIVPSQQAENDLIISPVYLRPGRDAGVYRTQARWHFVLAAAAFIMMSIGIGLVIQIVRASIKQKKRLQVPSNLDSLEENLRKLLHEKYLTPHWPYMARLSHLFREYLCVKFKLIKAPTGGSGAVFFEAVFHMVPEGLASGIKNIFYIVDNAVARELDVYPDLENLRSDILKVVDFRENAEQGRNDTT